MGQSGCDGHTMPLTRQVLGKTGGVWSDAGLFWSVVDPIDSDGERFRTGHARLAGSSAGQNRRDGLQDELPVLAGAAVFDIVEVELDPAIEGDVRAAGDLPDAGEPGNDGEALELVRGVGDDFIRERWTRADEGHVAAAGR